MVQDITCIFCGGVDVDNKHDCSVMSAGGDQCSPGTHIGTCTQCVGVLVQSFESQMRRKELPMPKLRVEEVQTNPPDECDLA